MLYFNRTFCKQTVKICSDAEKRGSDPGLHCLSMFRKKDTMLILYGFTCMVPVISVHFQKENKQCGS